MDTLKAILTRRSIRRFTSQVIEKSTIEKILQAAMYAPSARNFQPWHFVVIDKREVLDKIPNVHPYAEMCREAAAAIIVCGDTAIEKSVEYIALNCAASTQNILLAAHSLGLGSVWLGVYPRNDRITGLIGLMDLPSNIIPISLVAIGYPAEQKEPENRYNPDRVHYNRW